MPFLDQVTQLMDTATKSGEATRKAAGAATKKTATKKAAIKKKAMARKKTAKSV
jgi:hypothetical protein